MEPAELGAWDSALVVFLGAVVEACHARGVPADLAALPAEVRRLVELAREATVTERAAPEPSGTGIARLGEGALRRHERVRDGIAFVGDAALALGRFGAGRARLRGEDLWQLVQQSGAEALPIVALVNFLVGIILAFVGITQLRFFGAEAYVADIVGIAIVRDMGALITGVTAPKLDGASKDAAYFDVEFECEEVRWAKGGGQSIQGKSGPKQKQWRCSNASVRWSRSTTISSPGRALCSRIRRTDSRMSRRRPAGSRCRAARPDAS